MTSHASFAALRRGVPLLAALLLLPLCLTAGPALAESSTLRDDTGDMWTVREGATTGDPAPAARIGDIVRTTFRHTDTRLVVRTRFVELAPVGRRFTLWVGVRSRDGRETVLGVRASRRDRDGHTILMDDRGRDIDVCGEAPDQLCPRHGAGRGAADLPGRPREPAVQRAQRAVGTPSLLRAPGRRPHRGRPRTDPLDRTGPGGVIGCRPAPVRSGTCTRTAGAWSWSRRTATTG